MLLLAAPALLQTVAAFVTPVFTINAAPSSLPGYRDAGEPSIGANWNTGKIMYQSYVYTYRFDPSTASWTNVRPAASEINLDPILFTDHTTGRTFAGGLSGTCSLLFASDSDGAGVGGGWIPQADSCSGAGWDHETIGGGPFAAPLTGGTPAYQDAVYYCSQTGLTPGPAWCAMSPDGGLTYGPGTPLWTTQCGGLHGHVKVGPDGTAYVPNSICGSTQGFSYSTNNGLTWAFKSVTNLTKTDDFDPSIAIGGTTAKQNFYFCGRDGSGHAKVSVSTNKGLTISNTTDLSALASPVLANVEFPAAVAGDWDRAACAFLGTTTPGDTQSSGFAGVWHLYVAFTDNAGGAWHLVDATGADPVQKGCIWAGGGSNTCRNLLDFMDATIDSAGKVYVGFADGCTTSGGSTCPTGGASNWDSWATIARQTGGTDLIAP